MEGSAADPVHCHLVNLEPWTLALDLRQNGELKLKVLLSHCVIPPTTGCDCLSPQLRPRQKVAASATESPSRTQRRGLVEASIQ